MPDFDEKKDLTNIIANRLKNSFMKGEEISNMSLQQEQDLIGQKISTGLNLSSMYDSDEDEGPTLLYKHQKCYIAKLLLYSMLYNLQNCYIWHLNKGSGFPWGIHSLLYSFFNVLDPVI